MTNSEARRSSTGKSVTSARRKRHASYLLLGVCYARLKLQLAAHFSPFCLSQLLQLIGQIWEERRTAGSCWALASSLLSQDCVRGRKSGRVLCESCMTQSWRWAGLGASSSSSDWKQMERRPKTEFGGMWNRKSLLYVLDNFSVLVRTSMSLLEMILSFLVFSLDLAFFYRLGPVTIFFSLSLTLICNPFLKIPPSSTPFLLLPSVTHFILSERLTQWQITY